MVKIRQRFTVWALWVPLWGSYLKERNSDKNPLFFQTRRDASVHKHNMAVPSRLVRMTVAQEIKYSTGKTVSGRCRACTRSPIAISMERGLCGDCGRELDGSLA